MTSGADAATARGLGAVTLGLAAAALLVQGWRGRPAVSRSVRTRAHADGCVTACARVRPLPIDRSPLEGPRGDRSAGPPAAYAQDRGLAPTDTLRRAALDSADLSARGLHAPPALLDVPARGLHAAAALLAASVLADSAVEHARGGYDNPGMITPLISAFAALVAGASGAARARGRRAHGGVYGTALAVGGAGTAFHVYNLLARPGGISWANLFYGAPLGAPAALSLAGVLGLGALRSASDRGDRHASGRALCGIVCGALVGTTAEVALLHFRGAYQNPFMWLPVTVPPVAAVLIGAQAIAPASAPRGLARIGLALTGLLGIGGIGFHVYGVSRQMGGWRNWRQNVMSGPPLSAPPSYTALALAGLSSLALLERRAPAS